MASQRINITLDPDVDTVVGVLDGIEGAWDRAELGRRQAESGDTINLEDL